MNVYVKSEPQLRPRKLSGRCSSGAELGKGTRWHAVVDGDLPWGRALCGAKPGRLSAVGWQDEPGDTVTCPRCLARVATAERRATNAAVLLARRARVRSLRPEGEDR